MNTYLSKETQSKLNALTNIEIATSPSAYTFGQDIWKYGINSVLHIFLMSEAKNICHGKSSIQDFTQKYNLAFDEDYGFSGLMRSFEAEGIFIPDFKYWGRNRENAKIIFFDADYGNKLYSNPRRQAESWYLTHEHKWEPSDLQYQEVVNAGLQCGKDMWRACLIDFQKYKNGVGEEGKKHRKTKHHVTELAEQLMNYYSELVLNITHNEENKKFYMTRLI